MQNHEKLQKATSIEEKTPLILINTSSTKEERNTILSVVILVFLKVFDNIGILQNVL